MHARHIGQQREHAATHFLRGIAPLKEVFLLQLAQRALHSRCDRQHGGRVEKRAVGDAADGQARLSLRRIEKRRHAVLAIGALVRQVEIDRKHARRRVHGKAIGHADRQIDQPTFLKRNAAVAQLQFSRAAQQPEQPAIGRQHQAARGGRHSGGKAHDGMELVERNLPDSHKRRSLRLFLLIIARGFCVGC